MVNDYCDTVRMGLKGRCAGKGDPLSLKTAGCGRKAWKDGETIWQEKIAA